MCFGGLSELCCQSSFPISTMQPNELKTTLKKGDLAEIVKKVPAGLAAAAREAFTDSDTYTMSFQPEANLAPQQKAMMIASLVLVDYMFFEQDNGMCTYENGALKFTLFESYCCGCLLPCTVKLENRG